MLSVVVDVGNSSGKRVKIKGDAERVEERRRSQSEEEK